MNVFDDFSEAYDLMFPAASRLAGEGTFFEDLFRREKTASILDCACGTGVHLVHFAGLGVAAYGSDISAAMAEQAMAAALAAGVTVNVRVASFTELSRRFDADETFDAVVCLGNSLTLAPADDDVRRALAEMHGRLNPGGICVVGIFNWDLLAREGLRIMPASRGVKEGREVTFLRVFHHRGDRIDLNIVVMTAEGERLQTQVLTAHQRSVGPAQLAAFLKSAGFSSWEFFAGFDRSPFDPDSSSSLLVVARR